MKNSILFSIFFVSIFFLNTSCSKDPADSSENNPEILSGDGLSEEDNLYLESLSVPTPELNTIDFLSRKATEDQLSSIIKNMVTEAAKIADLKKNDKHAAEATTKDNVIKPEHFGVAYSYGQNDFTRRLLPPFGNTLHKKYAVFGIDCSGFMIYLLRREQIPIERISVEGFEEALKNAIKKNSIFKELIVENKGKLPIDQLKSGDFIVWLGIDPHDQKYKKHMGMIVKHGGKTDVFNSHGRDQPGTVDEQNKNYGLKRGVHTVSFDEAIKNAIKLKNQYWGVNYKIIRITSNCDNSTLAVTTKTTSNSATATATGGLAPYEFLWSNGVIGETVNNLAAGTYNVKVTDAALCTASTTVVISPPLVGQDGDPRFNLSFTNPANVDLDLYVKTPNGIIISYENPTGDAGTLDVDCLCSDCPQGPNENIFWQIGTAPSGTYEYWVEYYGSCNQDSATSSFTLTVTRNGTVLSTKTGTLSNQGKSPVYTLQQ